MIPLHPMHFRLLVLILLLLNGRVLIGAEEEPNELAQARSLFQKEMEFITRPVRDRYLSKLETLKRTLGSRGDARGAVAVQDEIDRTRLAQGDISTVRFAGRWLITY